MAARLLMGVLLLGVATMAAANFGSPPTAGEIMREQRAIREQTEGTGKYSRFKPEAMVRLTKAQEKVFRLLDGNQSVDHLDMNQKVELFNALEEVKAVLNDNDQDRLICRRESKVGTTIKETRCATVAQRKELEESSKAFMGPRTCGEGATPETDCGGNMREANTNPVYQGRRR
jgi:hypothetical protein